MDPAGETPTDILVEARKNLQFWIDSGLSREALMDLIVTSDAPTAQQHQQLQRQHPQQPAPQAQPLPSDSHHQLLQQTQQHAMHMQQQQQQQQQQPQQQQPPHIKTEPFSHDVSQDIILEDASVAPAMFGSRPSYFGHRPRISVASTTSTASSSHASVWSTNSKASSIMSSYSGVLPPIPSQSCPANKSLPGAQPPHGSATHSVPGGQGWAPGRLNFYWCTSCETRFKRKYDWKRHEEEFHERWKKYPCPEPGCNRSFWGANTFNQHHKASHGCKSCPHSEKVVKYLRKRKYWACGFCSALHPSRERHVEHVARHFESGKTKTDWMHSRVVYGLLHQPLIHEAWKDIMMSRHGELPSQQCNFSWNPTKTGRAQGFLENECPGQLQDLLEFFSGSSTDAEEIVRIAYDSADIVYQPGGPFSSPTSATATTTPSHDMQPYPTPPDSSLSPTGPRASTSTLITSMHSPLMPGGQPGLMTAETTPTSPVSFATQPFHSPVEAAPPAQQTQMMAAPTIFGPPSHPPPPPPTMGHGDESLQPAQRSSLDRALPPLPPVGGETVVTTTTASGAPSINFDFLPNTMMLDDWDGFANTAGVHHSMPPPPSQLPMATDWPIFQYYNPQPPPHPQHPQGGS